MGKACQACCDATDAKTEHTIGLHPQLVLQKFNTNQSESQNGQSSTSLEMEDDKTKLFQDNIEKIVSLQSLYRGYKARKNFSFLKSKAMKSSKYFTLQEIMEVQMEKYPLNPKKPYVRESRPKYQFKSGSTYEGEWCGPFRDGFGTQTWTDGASYTGNWKQNKACGIGKFIHTDDEVYHGSWRNDKANGFGVYMHQDGGHFVGEMKDDLSHGFGVENWNDNSKYHGNYSLGSKNGFGVYKWGNGTSYVGNWMNNQMEGYGTYKFPDGRYYQGEWKDNKMQGVGIQKWLDGRQYQGEYLNDKKHGFGIFEWSDDKVYTGYWANGKQHGPGTYTKKSDGTIKQGVWEHGKVIKWFDYDVDNNVADKIMKFTQFFQEADSANLIPRHASLRQPLNFDKRLTKVANNIFEINSQQTIYGLKAKHFVQKARDEKLLVTDQPDKILQ